MLKKNYESKIEENKVLISSDKSLIEIDSNQIVFMRIKLKQ